MGDDHMDDRGGEVLMSRRKFVKRSVATGAVLAVPGLMVWRRRPRRKTANAFDLRFAEDVDVLFAFGRRKGTYDIEVRRNGETVERFQGVPALEVAYLDSDYVTARAVA